MSPIVMAVGGLCLLGILGWIWYKCFDGDNDD